MNPLGFGRISATEDLQEELQHGTPVAALQGTSGWVYAAYGIFILAAAAAIAWYVYQQRQAEVMQPLPTNVEPTPAKVSDTPPLIDKNAVPAPDVTPMPPVPIETRRLEGPEPPPGYVEGAPEASALVDDNGVESPEAPKAQPDAGMAPMNVREAELLLTTARGAESKMQWVRARGFYERVARGKHKRAAGLLGLASVSWQTGDLDAAIGWAQKALDAGAGDGARIVMGHAYLRQKRFDQAELYYRTVLKTDNDSVEALRGLEAVKKAREK